MTTPNPQPTPKPPIYPDYCHVLSPTISRWCPLRAIDIHALRSVGMYVDGREIYYYSNHPIKWARITGVVVAIDEFRERKVLTIDDSSGACIECACACPALPLSTSAAAVPGHLDQFWVQVTAPGNRSKAITGSKSATENKSKAESKESTCRKEDAKKPEQPSVKEPQIPWSDLDIGSVVKIKGQVGKFRDTKQIDVIKIDIMGGTELEVKCWDEMLAFRQNVLSRPWSLTNEEEAKCREDKEKALRLDKKNPKPGVRKGSAITAKGESSKQKEEEVSKKSAKRKEMETDEERRYRHEQRKRKKWKEEGLDSEGKVNYPSMAFRRGVAGKYDALGI